MEIWKEINDFPGYLVSNEGRIKKASTGQIMSLSKNGGYLRFTVTKHVHRLVADAFIEKPKDKTKCWVDHIDGNRSNNKVENLRWVNPSENATAFGYEARRIHKMRKVRATNLNGETITFESRQAAADYFNCQDSEIEYNHRYARGNKRGWMFQKVEDIV